MGIVGTGFATSLDGFIARPDGSVGPLFDWYFGGDTEVQYPGGMAVTVSEASAEVIRATIQSTGALVVGRRHWDEANA